VAFWDCVLLALLCGDRIICVAVLEKKEEWSAQKSPLSINGAHHNQACHRVAASLLFALLTPRAGIAYNSFWLISASSALKKCEETPGLKRNGTL
jgi:hypothetical protein